MIRETVLLLMLLVVALGVDAQESQAIQKTGVCTQAICNQRINDASNSTRLDVSQSTQQHDLYASSAIRAPVAAAFCKKADDPDSSCKDNNDCCKGYSCVATTAGKFCLKDAP
jgi:hypothetical protein